MPGPEWIPHLKWEVIKWHCLIRINQMFKRKALMEHLVLLERNTHSHMYQLISSLDVFILLDKYGLCFQRILLFEVVITVFYFLCEF